MPTDQLPVATQLTILEQIVKTARSGDVIAEINASDVRKTTGRRESDISRCLLFFREANLVQQERKGRPFKPTNHAISFEIEWDDSKKREALRAAFQGVWFTDVANNILSGGQVMARSDLVTRLARAAEAEKTKIVEQKLEKLVDFMMHAGIIEVE